MRTHLAKGSRAPALAWRSRAGLRPDWLKAHSGDEATGRPALAGMADRLRGCFTRRLSGSPAGVEVDVQQTLQALQLHRVPDDLQVPVTAWMQTIACLERVEVDSRLERLSVAEAAGRSGLAATSIGSMFLWVPCVAWCHRRTLAVARVVPCSSRISPPPRQPRRGTAQASAGTSLA